MVIFFALIASGLFARCNAQPAVVASGQALNFEPLSSPDHRPARVNVQAAARAGPDVLQHHLHASRDGLYADPAFTPSAAAQLHLDPSFNAPIQGPVYAQPLYVSNGPSGKAALVVATEQNIVYALDAQSGAVLWQKTLGPPVPLSALPCGNIDPLGITGTPIIDASSRTVYLDAMTAGKHLIFALSLDNGSTRAGWPVDVAASVTANGIAFDPLVQNQRAALAILGGTLYVGYGGHLGDCGDYRGWIVGVPLMNPASPKAWVASAQGGAVWAPAGIVSDGTSLWVSTGNTAGASSWAGGEAVLRLSAGPGFSGSPMDYFAPSNWQALDVEDLDLGGTQPALVNLPAQSGAPARQLVLAFGKDGKCYVLDRSNLGGVGGELESKLVSSSELITAAATIPTAGGARVVLKGTGVGCPSAPGDLLAVDVANGSPPRLSIAWCASQNGLGTPILTTTDGSANAIVWGVGAEGDNRVHGFDAGTGAVIFAGGGAAEAMGPIRRYQTPIVAAGGLYVAGDQRVYRFVTGGG